MALIFKREAIPLIANIEVGSVPPEPVAQSIPTKTQTRRLCKPREYGRVSSLLDIEQGTYVALCRAVMISKVDRMLRTSSTKGPYIWTSTAHAQQLFRAKWRVGRDYAVKSARTSPAVMIRGLGYAFPDNLDHKRSLARLGFVELRIKIISIKRERLQMISEHDAYAEGVNADNCGDWLGDPVGCFRELWDSINERPGERWADNPWVWALHFTRAQ